MEYKKHITSDETNYCFLHRTWHDCVDRIMLEGLGCGAEDLESTATRQPSILNDAEDVYRLRHKRDDSVIVINIPRNLIDSLPNEDKRSLAAIKGIGYYHPKRGFTIRPEHVKGWIDRKNDEYHPNPYEDRKPFEGHEKLFDVIFESHKNFDNSQFYNSKENQKEEYNLDNIDLDKIIVVD